MGLTGEAKWKRQSCSADCSPSKRERYLGQPLPLAPRGTHILLLEHLSNGSLVLITQRCQFSHLLLLEFFDNSFLLRLGRGLQDVLLQCLVLPLLRLYRFVELLANLDLFGLDGG